MARVLLVEDDDTILSAYGLALQQAGFEVAMAQDGEEALRVAGQHEPDVILLDLLMPHMDGIEFLKSYNIKQVHPDAQAIVFTNMAADSTKQKAAELGAVKYLTKSSYTPKQIVEIVNDLLKPHS